MLGPYLQACWISYAFESWAATELGVANKSRGNIFPNAKRRRWGQTLRYKTFVWIGIKSKRLLNFYSFVRGQCKVHKNLKYTAKMNNWILQTYISKKWEIATTLTCRLDDIWLTCSLLTVIAFCEVWRILLRMFSYENICCNLAATLYNSFSVIIYILTNDQSGMAFISNQQLAHTVKGFTTEYTQSGNGRLLAYIPSWKK
jgi:hypothetical protein